MITFQRFQDAVTAANLNPNQTHAVYYADGKFANRTAVKARCPKATLYGITVHGLTGPSVAACDCENGDLTPAQAVAWVATQVKLNVPLVIVYADLSTWKGGLLKSLEHYGKRIKRWVAHFDGIPEIPAGFDCKQFSDPGPVDDNVALNDFFVPVTPKPDVPHGHVRFIGTYDIGTRKLVGVHGLPGSGVHFTGPENWMDVDLQIQVGKGGGHWRAKP
jgi:hypothetical protein